MASAFLAMKSWCTLLWIWKHDFPAFIRDVFVHLCKSVVFETGYYTVMEIKKFPAAKNKSSIGPESCNLNTHTMYLPN